MHNDQWHTGNRLLNTAGGRGLHSAVCPQERSLGHRRPSWERLITWGNPHPLISRPDEVRTGCRDHCSLWRWPPLHSCTTPLRITAKKDAPLLGRVQHRRCGRHSVTIDKEGGGTVWSCTCPSASRGDDGQTGIPCLDPAVVLRPTVTGLWQLSGSSQTNDPMGSLCPCYGGRPASF